MKTMMRGRPPSLLERAWYRRVHVRVPVSCTSKQGVLMAVLVPYRLRRVHRWYALHNHFFWLPCPLCSTPFGGHEAGQSIPDPIEGPGRGIMICSRCSRSRAVTR